MNIKFLLKEKKEIKFNNKIYILCLLIDFYSVIIISTIINWLNFYSLLYFIILPYSRELIWSKITTLLINVQKIVDTLCVSIF